jgi:GINS complex subunit 1
MQSATRLLTDLRGSTSLLPYAEDTVRAVLNDIVGLSQGIEERLRAGSEGAGDASAHALTVVQNFTLRRHKRCLIVYHSARCARVEALRWNTGAVLPPGARDNLCSTEVDYFKAYSEAVSHYLDLTGLDLTAVRFCCPPHCFPLRARSCNAAVPKPQSLKPPKLDRIPVLAIKDCGVVQTASGPRTVSRGETHFMSRAEVEPLVRQGLMVQLSE